MGEEHLATCNLQCKQLQARQLTNTAALVGGNSLCVGRAGATKTFAGCQAANCRIVPRWTRSFHVRVRPTTPSTLSRATALPGRSLPGEGCNPSRDYDVTPTQSLVHYVRIPNPRSTLAWSCLKGVDSRAVGPAFLFPPFLYSPAFPPSCTRLDFPAFSFPKSTLVPILASSELSVTARSPGQFPRSRGRKLDGNQHNRPCAPLHASSTHISASPLTDRTTGWIRLGRTLSVTIIDNYRIQHRTRPTR
ncbi:hypothetical protein BC834DRAFT_330564 [Gloeopeniophorella convolvens]|nr:hypothetical protein BC834DRAFT_330564 [Gloeopeniophorella convolvens]